MAALRGKGDGTLAPKPFLWETHIVPVNDAEKGWAGLFVRLQPLLSLNYRRAQL